MKKLLEKVRQLELEKASEQKRRQELEKKLEFVQPLSQNRYTLAPTLRPALTPVDQKSLNQLLQYVAEGEQDKAEKMLKGKSGGLLGWGEIKANPDLLSHRSTVKDLSGREFKQITAFQYALWAMDWHMWTMIQKYLPQEAQAQQCARIRNQRHGAW